MVTDLKKKIALEFFLLGWGGDGYSAQGIHVGCVEISVSIWYEESQACIQIIYEIFFVSQQLQI
jgi:hypothetical protein